MTHFFPSCLQDAEVPVPTVVADRATYHNYQVRRIYPENQEQIEVLRELENNPNEVLYLFVGTLKSFVIGI